MRLLENTPLAIERAIREPKDEPLQLTSYADAASLPAASDWPFGLAHVLDINTIAFSDGTDWYPLDKGGSL